MIKPNMVMKNYTGLEELLLFHAGTEVFEISPE